MTRKVTDAQLLEALDAYWEQHGIGPTVRELGRAVGLASSASVHFRLLRLADQGRVQRRKLSALRVLYRTVDRADTATGETA